MKYTAEIEIKAPREKVVAHFQDPNDLKKWQPELVSMAAIKGEPGAAGSQTEMTYKSKRMEYSIVETITKNALPETFDAIYENKMAKNRTHNEFKAIDANTTRWTMENEFKLRGMLKIIAFFSPGMFKKETNRSMKRFKEMVEGAN